jgi:ribulose 1,5-bisphosphate carboxylase large subunit-like protein
LPATGQRTTSRSVRAGYDASMTILNIRNNCKWMAKLPAASKSQVYIEDASRNPGAGRRAQGFL